MVGDGRLPQREVIGDVTDADWFRARGEEVEDADAGGIGEGLEPGGVGLGVRLGDGGRAGRRAAGLIEDGNGRALEGGRHEKDSLLEGSIEDSLMFVNGWP